MPVGAVQADTVIEILHPRHAGQVVGVRRTGCPAHAILRERGPHLEQALVGVGAGQARRDDSRVDGDVIVISDQDLLVHVDGYPAARDAFRTLVLDRFAEDALLDPLIRPDQNPRQPSRDDICENRLTVS